MNVIPTNLNDLKEDIRHASPSRLRSYQIQLEAYTAFISVYDGVKGSTEDKINAANKIINDLFLLEMDRLGYYFDRECAETAKTGLEYSLQEKYTGKYAKSIKLLPSILQLSEFGYRHIKARQLEYLANGLEVDTFTVYYLERLHNVITPKGYLTPQEIARQVKITWQVMIEYLRTYTK